MRMPRVNSSAAKMAVADELIYRIVNRCAQSADLPPIASITEGARSNALSCVSSVTSTLLLSVTKDLPLDKNDVLFHCLKGARGAWVLLRAAQVWDRQIGRAYGQVAHSDGATEEGRFAILPPSEEERIKELAHLCATTAHRPPPTAHRPPPTAHCRCVFVLRQVQAGTLEAARRDCEDTRRRAATYALVSPAVE